MVNVNGTPRELVAHVVTKHLHIARKHHQFGTFCVNNLALPCFGLRLGGRGNANVMEWNVVAGRQLVKFAVVRDNGANIECQQAAFPAKQQVVEAMPLFAHHDHGAHRLRCGVQAPAHGKGRCKVGQLGAQGFVA